MATLFTIGRARRILPFLTPIQPNTGDKAMDTPLFRIEHDLLGDREVPADVYYGVHTLRARENFAITHNEGGSVVDFILKPKSKDSLFDSLRLSFRGNVLNDMQLVDSIGQRTNILFLNVQLNESVDDSLFSFEIPQGADVIQE